MSIITNLKKLQKPAEPLQFRTEKGIEKEGIIPSYFNLLENL